MRATTILLLLLGFTSHPVRGDTSNVRTLTVSGAVELATAPDQASFSFELYSKADQLGDAIAQTRKKANSLCANLKEMGLTDANLSTGWFSSGPYYVDIDSYHNVRKQDGYESRVSINVELDSLNLLEHAMALVSESKPNSMSGATFALKNFEKVKGEALRRAILKAREKSEIMAQASACKLGEVLQIEETTGQHGGGYYSQSPFNAAYNFKASEPQEPDVSALAMPNDIKTSASVRLTLSIDRPESK